MQNEIDDLTRDPDVAGVNWGICIASGGEVRAEVDADAEFVTASIGKLFLLLDLAQKIYAGELNPADPVALSNEGRVEDSGLLQYFSAKELPISDLAVLIAAVSDNYATNLALSKVGLESVQSVSRALGLDRSFMLDRIRDERRPEDPQAPSVGSARELARVVRMIGTGEALSVDVSKQVASWLSLNTDLSMVAAAFNVDPLAHGHGEAGVRLFNKTGTDAGVRADTGWVSVGSGSPVSYAVIANWAAGSVSSEDAVLAVIHQIGVLVRHSAVTY